MGEQMIGEQIVKDLEDLESLKNGNQVVREKIIIANLQRVHYLAKKHSNRSALYDDLVQEGTIGLIKAVDLWVKSHSLNKDRIAPYELEDFNKYIARHISARIRSALNNEHLIYIPKWIFKRIPKARERISKRKQERISSILQLANKALELMMEGDMAQRFFRGMIYEEYEKPKRFEVNIIQLLDQVTFPRGKSSRVKPIILMRYGLEGYHAHILEDIGQKLGISREMVRIIENNTLRKLRRILEEMSVTTVEDALFEDT